MPLFTGHYGGPGQADGYTSASEGGSTGVGCGCAALIVGVILLMVAVFVVVGYFAVADAIETSFVYRSSSITSL